MTVDPEQVRQGELAALQALAQRRHGEAERAANAVLALDPRSARGRAVLGNALRVRAAASDPPDLDLVQRGDGETLTAVRLAPLDPVVAGLRAQFLGDVGHLSAAAAAAEDCLMRLPAGADPDRLDLLDLAGQFAYELGEELRALPHLRALAVHRVDDAALHFRLGACLLRTAVDAATAADAATAFARGAELAPGDDDVHLAVVAAHFRAAELARQSGDDQRAQEQLGLAATAARAVAARFERSAEAAFRVGAVAEAQQDLTAARANYDEALRRDAEHLGSLLNLASLCAATPETGARARELWRRALAVDERRGGLSAAERARVSALAAD